METIVFVHGLGSGPRAWHPQRIALQGHYRIVTVTLPGHGDSPGPFTFRDAVETVADAIEDGCHLVGMAAGGTIALMAAMSHPDRLASLTVSAPIIRLRGLATMHHRIAPVAPVGLLKHMLHIPELSSSAARTIVAEDLATSGRQVIAQGLAKLAHTDLRHRLQQVSTRSLVVAGRKDPQGLEAAAHTARLLPNATLTVADDAGRMWNLELPNTFNRILTGFIDTNAEQSPTIAVAN
ncbi:MAG TPA: alpha/beta fold hydrolase [Candidatus Stackebrandtia excrementipullorum]|nr:alpha/beta fold hydrolase [Candidatus Stackebrandtia excrementipullorum]